MGTEEEGASECGGGEEGGDIPRGGQPPEAGADVLRLHGGPGEAEGAGAGVEERPEDGRGAGGRVLEAERGGALCAVGAEVHPARGVARGELRIDGASAARDGAQAARLGGRVSA